MPELESGVMTLRRENRVDRPKGRWRGRFLLIATIIAIGGVVHFYGDELETGAARASEYVLNVLDPILGTGNTQ